MSLNGKPDIPPGLKKRPGLNGSQRLPSINGLLNRLNGSANSASLRATSPLINSQVTRGGVTKRVFKPNIPLKLERSKEEEQHSEQSKAPKQFTKPNDPKKNNVKGKKEYIQIEATFEGFKAEAKRTSYSNGHASGGCGLSGTKRETTEKRFKSDGSKRPEVQSARDEDYQSDDDLDDDLNIDEEDMPISWANYSKMINQFSNLNKQENSVEEKIESGRLILMPCIFGNMTGDTGYKLQVLKSGRMRLVDKKSGFTIDLLNTGELEHDAIKEVVELDDDKLLRYGSLSNSDIYSPVRSLDSDYNSILHD